MLEEYNNIILICVTFITTFIACGIINLMNVKKQSTLLKKAIAVVPTDRKKIMCVLLMLAYMVLLDVMLICFYQENFVLNLKIVCLASLMWPMAQIDKKQLRIPNKLILVGLGYRLAILIFEVVFFREHLLSVVIAEVLSSIAIAVVLLISGLLVKNGIGMGDIKFFMLMALMLGPYRFISSLLLIMIIAFFVSLYKLVIKKNDKKTEFPFGPIIALGSLLSFIIFGS